MFEIGASLREARLRQGLDFPEIETGTKVRGKYLQALEEEHFDVLPGETYIKGFLRTYADYLGLDGQLYVDEFNSRFASGEDDLPTLARPRRPRSGGERQVEATVVLVALAGIAAIAALVVVAWKWGSTHDERAPLVRPPAVTGKKESGGKAAAPWFGLRVQATFGPTRLVVRRGSAHGTVLYRGTVAENSQVVRQGRRLWVRITRPENVLVRVHGRAIDLGEDVRAPATYVATAKGLRPVT